MHHGKALLLGSCHVCCCATTRCSATAWPLQRSPALITTLLRILHSCCWRLVASTLREGRKQTQLDGAPHRRASREVAAPLPG